MPAEVTSEIRGQSLIVTFNCPERNNRMTLDMATQLFTILKGVTSDRAIRAVLLCGKGEHFMGGLELNMFAGDLDRAMTNVHQLMLPYHSAIRELQGMEKPVVAAVQGEVFGPGLSLMLASDLVMAAPSARFRTHFTSYAMSPDGASSFFLSRKAGAAKANELLMLNEEFDPAAAEKLQIINRVVGEDQLQDEAMRWTTQLAEGPTRALGAVKKLVLKAFDQDLGAHLGLEHTYWGANLRTFDFRESIRAHFAKRPPRYTGA